MIEEDKKLFKLLELLGKYHEQGCTLVFVDKQENADEVMKQLMKHAYPCMALHGGIDQYDRDSTILDFKNGVFKVMVSLQFHRYCCCVIVGPAGELVRLQWRKFVSWCYPMTCYLFAFAVPME